jgi:hypothetical protein
MKHQLMAKAERRPMFRSLLGAILFALGISVFGHAPAQVMPAGRAYFEPQTALPDASGIVKTSLMVAGVPEPGARTFAVSVTFSGDDLNLVEAVNTLSGDDPMPPADKITCAASPQVGSTAQSVGSIPFDYAVLRSALGQGYQEGKGTQPISIISSLNADTGLVRVDASLLGQNINGPTGSFSLIDFVCYYGPNVPPGASVRVDVGVAPGLSGVVILDESGSQPIINSFDAGYIGAASPCDDADGDGICDPEDTCPLDADNDADGDSVCGNVDNCPLTANEDQADLDGDGVGDVCDDDRDGDGVADVDDNCPLTANEDQADLDGDGVGDVCDDDRDGDGVADDNCPTTTAR